MTLSHMIAASTAFVPLALGLSAYHATQIVRCREACTQWVALAIEWQAQGFDPEVAIALENLAAARRRLRMTLRLAALWLALATMCASGAKRISSFPLAKP